MARTFTASDLELLGYERVEELPVGPTFQLSCYTAHVPAGLATVSALFVYLKAAATAADTAEAARLLTRRVDQKYIFLPKALSDRAASIKSAMPVGVSVEVHEDAIWRVVSNQFAPYLRKLAEQLPSVAHYVTPRPEREPEGRLDDVLVRRLSQSGGTSAQHVTVVLADAGIGKTTIAREIVRRVASAVPTARAIPVYLEAGQWVRVSDSFDDLWEIALHSVRHFDPSFRFTGAQLHHLLRVGTIVFVIDGFDELCASSGQFNARDTLGTLLTLAADSDARVLLTSRTLYWLGEVGDQYTQKVTLEHLAPFTKQQALDYLARRFKEGTDKWQAARDLLDRIKPLNQPATAGGGKKQIVYHPFVMSLIGDAVESPVGSLNGYGEQSTGMYAILESFCAREKLRQGLRTSADAQMLAFEVLGSEDAQSFTIDDCVIAGFDNADLAKINVHPLLEADKDAPGKYRFRYTFLPLLFKARRLSRWINHDGTVFDHHVRRAAQECYRGGILIDHVLAFWGRGNDADSLSKAFADVPADAAGAKSFLFHLARAWVEQHQGNMSKVERTEELFRMLGRWHAPAKTVDDIHVYGTIDKLNLTGVTFAGCTFVDVVFSDCEVDRTTKFVNCTFAGDFELLGITRAMWRDAKKLECKMDKPAELLSGGEIAPKETAEELLALALGRFWKSGRIERTIARVNWNKGVLGRHPACSSVLEALIRAKIVENVLIAGVKEGGLLLVRDADADVQRYMDNRRKTGRVLVALNEIQSSL